MLYKNPLKNHLNLWVLLLLLTTSAVLISIVWIDRPVAFLVHEAFGSRKFSQVAASRVLSIPLASAFVFTACGIFVTAGGKLSRWGTAIVLADIALITADTIKDQLKTIFGRTWPDSWGPDVTSLVHDGAYKFNFFHSDFTSGSFPSGHAAAAASVASVLWLLFPRMRILISLGIAGVDVGLVLLNLHFVSDVLAGTFVGCSAGFFTMALSRRLRDAANRMGTTR